MSHTNSTTNYGLPQFLTGDKPAWLTDINNAFSDIDTAVYNAQTKANTAYTDAGNAQGDATTALTNAAAADAKGAGALASIETTFDSTATYSVGAKVIYNSLLYRCTVAIVTPGAWTGSDNWERITVDSLISTSDSKIGLLSSLSTTDKTSVVNAVNEVNGSVGNISQLTTTVKSSLVGAVNEVNGKHLTSSDISNFVTNNDKWTPTNDGFLNIRASGSISGAAYIYVYEGTTARGTIALPNGTGGLTYTINMPVLKNVEYLLLMGGFTSCISTFFYYT